MHKFDFPLRWRYSPYRQIVCIKKNVKKKRRNVQFDARWLRKITVATSVKDDANIKRMTDGYNDNDH